MSFVRKREEKKLQKGKEEKIWNEKWRELVDISEFHANNYQRNLISKSAESFIIK